LDQAFAPTSTETLDGARFWIEDTIEIALDTILAVYDIYSMRVVDRTPTTGEDGSLAGMICIEEEVSSIQTSVPEYIGRLDSYSEKDCRDICLQIAKCIDILHNEGIAHRNLHSENVLIDIFVSNDRLFPVRVERLVDRTHATRSIIDLNRGKLP
jgi:serine/threonine protein kinase